MSFRQTICQCLEVNSQMLKTVRLISFLLLFMPTLAAGNIILPTVEGFPGQTVELNVTVNMAEGAKALLLDIAFDQEYFFAESPYAASDIGRMEHATTAFAGGVRLLLFSTEDQKVYSGTILTIPLRIAGNTPTGKHAITVVEVQTVDGDGMEADDHQVTQGAVIVSINEAPSEAKATIETSQNQKSPGVLPQVVDRDGETGHALEIADNPEFGSARVEDGFLFYTPDAEFSGKDRFTFLAIDRAGLWVEGEADVLVHPARPLQIRVHAPPLVAANQTFQVDLVITGSQGSQWTSFWDMGDGTRYVNTVPAEHSLTHCYREPGSFTLQLVVQDAWGTTANFSILVQVLALEDPVCNLAAQQVRPGIVRLNWQGGADPNQRLEGYDIVLVDQQGRHAIAEQWPGTSLELPPLPPGVKAHVELTPRYRNGVRGATQSLPITIEGTEDHILRFGHITHNPLWWTGIALVNPHQQPVPLRLRAFGSGGALVGISPRTELAPGEKVLGLASTFFAEDILAQAQWLELRSDRSLVGFELFGTTTITNSTGIPAVAETQKTGGIFIFDGAADAWTGISLVNTSSSAPATIKVFADRDDRRVPGPPLILRPLEKRALLARDLLGKTWARETKAIHWQADQPLFAFGLWGDVGDFQRASGSLALEHGSLRSIIPLIESQSTLILHNPNRVPATLVVELLDSLGEIVVARDIALAPYQQFQQELNTWVNTAFQGSLRLNASAPILAAAELHHFHGSHVLGESIPAQVHSFQELLIPHVAKSSQWRTDAALVNASNQKLTATLTAMSPEGSYLGEVAITLASHGQMLVPLSELFSNLGQTAYVRVSASEPKLMGHLLFESLPGFGQIMGGVPLVPLH